MSRHPKMPPYSPAHAHKVIADFEHAVREHEMLGCHHPMEHAEIEKHYDEQKQKMFDRLTEPTISTRIKK